jgi:dihydroxyacetone kinase
MSLIVEQTLPYSRSDLKLDDQKRWSRLFPLIRPSVKSVDLSNGHTVIVDTTLAKSKDVLLAAVGSTGNFSSKILSESHLSLFTTEEAGKQDVSTEDILKFLSESGYPVRNGLVVVKTGAKQDLRVVSERVVEVSVVRELKLDHLLSLLSAANLQTK